MSYDWIFFDADGTLFDYDSAQGAALEGAFEACGFSYAPTIGSLYSEINAEIWRDFELGAIDQKELKTPRFDRLFGEVG